MRAVIEELDVFKLCGPRYLVDSGDPWSHANSTRAAMACLVQAVYALEKDNSSVLKMGLEPLAPHWYAPFKYKLYKTLEIRDEGSAQKSTVIGAVFKWSRRRSLLRPAAAPPVVVALRGTIPAIRGDLRADASLLVLQLQNTSRFELVLEEVEALVARHGAGAVCLAGHSLGAALCMLVGRAVLLAHPEIRAWKAGTQLLPAHLFNPPFPPTLLDNFVFSAKLRLAKAAKKLFDAAGDFLRQEADDGDNDILRQHWCPQLYVNPCDPICAPYISYFQNLFKHEDSEGAHAHAHEKVSNLYKSSVRRQVIEACLGREAVFFHLVPCACIHLIKIQSDEAANVKHRDDDGVLSQFLRTHGLKQWWSLETQIDTLQVGTTHS